MTSAERFDLYLEHLSEGLGHADWSDLSSLSNLRHMEERLAQQLGIRPSIASSPNEVRSLRGIVTLVHEQPRLCRKTRQAIPAAIRKSMEQRPEIAFELLNESGLFAGL